MLWRLLLAMMLLAVDVRARESLQEANLPGGADNKDRGHSVQSRERHGTEEGGGIEMNYDYFMQEGDHDPRLRSSSRGSAKPSSGEGKAPSLRQEAEEEDPFSVFYDSPFSEMDPFIHLDDPEIAAENAPSGPPPMTRAPAGTTASPSPPPPQRRTTPAAVTTTRPFNESSSLAAVIPAFLKKMGISESSVDMLIEKEKSVLGGNLFNMLEGEAFREVANIISELGSLDPASLPKLLDKLDSPLVTSIVKGANMTKVKDVMNSLDNYLDGIFGREGSAAQNPTGEGSKSVFLPLTGTGNLATVQLVGFVLLMVVLLAAAATFAFSYLGDDISSVRKHKYASRKQLMTTEAPIGWPGDDQKWLQAVDVAEISPDKWQEQWPGSRPSYFREEAQVRHPPRVPRPSEANLHYHHLPKERPPLDLQRPHHAHQQSVVVATPEEEHVNYHYSGYEDYQDQYADEGDDRPIDYYYHEPSPSSSSSSSRDAAEERLVPQHYHTTQKPTSDVQPATHTSKGSSTTTTTTTTTASPRTRPTSKYVRTMRPHRNITRKRPTRPTTTER